MHNVLINFINFLFSLFIIFFPFIVLIFLYFLFRLAIFLFPLSKANEEMNISDVFIIKKKTFIRDIFQICLIFLIILIPIISFRAIIDYKYYNAPLHCYNPSPEIKHSISVLNQALTTGKSIQNIDSKDSSGDIARFFEKHLNIVAGYNYKNFKGKFNSYKPKWYYKDVLDDDFKKLPILFDSRETMLIVLKANNDCGTKPVLDHNKASCVLLADVNGLRPPNRLIESDKLYSQIPKEMADRYYIILTNNGAYLEKSLWDKILEIP